MLGKGSGRLSGQTRLSGQLSLFGSQISAGFPLHAGAHGRPCPLSDPDQSVHGNVPRGNEWHGHDDGGGYAHDCDGHDVSGYDGHDRYGHDVNYARSTKSSKEQPKRSALRKRAADMAQWLLCCMRTQIEVPTKQ